MLATLVSDYDFMGKKREQRTAWHASIWIASGSSTMVIPKPLAKLYKMDRPCDVMVEAREGGLFIRKLSS
jgi:hypothetical protein